MQISKEILATNGPLKLTQSQARSLLRLWIVNSFGGQSFVLICGDITDRVFNAGKNFIEVEIT